MSALSDRATSRVLVVPDPAILERAVAALGPDWCLLPDCRTAAIGTGQAGMRLPALLINRNIGIALLDMAPRVTPDAVEHVRRALKAAHFHKTFPGYLPIVHRMLTPEHLDRLPDILDFAFSWEGPLTLPHGQAWADMVQYVLSGEPPRVQNREAESVAETAGMPERRHSPGWMLAGLGILMAAGGGAAFWPYAAPDPHEPGRLSPQLAEGSARPVEAAASASMSGLERAMAAGPTFAIETAPTASDSGGLLPPETALFSAPEPLRTAAEPAPQPEAVPSPISPMDEIALAAYLGVPHWEHAETTASREADKAPAPIGEEAGPVTDLTLAATAEPGTRDTWSRLPPDTAAFSAPEPLRTAAEPAPQPEAVPSPISPMDEVALAAHLVAHQQAPPTEHAEVMASGAADMPPASTEDQVEPAIGLAFVTEAEPVASDSRSHLSFATSPSNTLESVSAAAAPEAMPSSGSAMIEVAPAAHVADGQVERDPAVEYAEVTVSQSDRTPPAPAGDEVEQAINPASIVAEAEPLAGDAGSLLPPEMRSPAMLGLLHAAAEPAPQPEAVPLPISPMDEVALAADRTAPLRERTETTASRAADTAPAPMGEDAGPAASLAFGGEAEPLADDAGSLLPPDMAPFATPKSIEATAEPEAVPSSGSMMAALAPAALAELPMELAEPVVSQSAGTPTAVSAEPLAVAPVADSVRVGASRPPLNGADRNETGSPPPLTSAEGAGGATHPADGQVLPAPVAMVPTLPPATLAILLRRGESMLALGDMSAARLFYERAAAAGSGEAATALGKTYDPQMLARLGARGIAGDPTAAARWYRAALALNDATAGPLLARLEGRNP